VSHGQAAIENERYVPAPQEVQVVLDPEQVAQLISHDWQLPAETK